jgi:hypothetical protein
VTIGGQTHYRLAAEVQIPLSDRPVTDARVWVDAHSTSGTFLPVLITAWRLTL